MRSSSPSPTRVHFSPQLQYTATPLSASSRSTPSSPRLNGFRPHHLPASIRHSILAATAESEAKLAEHQRKRSEQTKREQVEEEEYRRRTPSPVKLAVSRHLFPTRSEPGHSFLTSNERHTGQLNSSVTTSIRITRPFVRRTSAPDSSPRQSSSSPLSSTPRLPRTMSASPERSSSFKQPQRTEQISEPIVSLLSPRMARKQGRMPALQRLEQLLAKHNAHLTQEETARPRPPMPLPTGLSAAYVPQPSPSQHARPVASLPFHFATPSFPAAEAASFSSLTPAFPIASPAFSTPVHREDAHGPSPPLLPYPVASPAAVQETYDSDDDTTLRRKLGVLQSELASTQHTLNDHIAANQTLFSQYQALERENDELHDLLDQRYKLMQKSVHEREQLVLKLDQSLRENESAEEVKVRYREKYESKLQVIVLEHTEQLDQERKRLNKILEQSQLELVSQMKEFELAKAAEIEQLKRQLGETQIQLASTGAFSTQLQDHFEEEVQRRLAAVEKDKQDTILAVKGEHQQRTEAAIEESLRGKQKELERTMSALQAQKRARITNILSRWRLTSLTPVFLEWRGIARTKRERRKEVLGRMARKIERLPLHLGFRTWRVQTEQMAIESMRDKLQQQKSARVRLLVQKWRLSSLGPMFLAWTSYVRSTRQRKREVLDRACKRMAHHQTYSAMRQWRRTLEKEDIQHMRTQVQTQKLARITALIQRWRLHSLTPYFLGWKTYSRAHRRRKHEVLGRVLRKMEKLKEHQALRHWRLFTEQSKLSTLQAHMQSQLTHEKQQRIRALIARWRLSSLGPIFLAWTHYASSAKKRKREILGRSIVRLAHSHLFRAWTTWGRFVESTRIAVMEKQLSVAEGVIQSEKRKRAYAAISAWRQRSVVPVFHEWKSYARTTRQRKRELCGRMLNRLANLNLYRSFKRWKLFVEHDEVAHLETRFSEKYAALQGELVVSKRKRAAALIQRWRMASTTPSFQAWRKYAGDRRVRKRELLGKMLSRMGNLALYSGFKRWTLYVSQSQLAQMRARFVKQNSQLQGDLLLQKQKRVAALVQQWRMASSTPVFHAWRQYTRANRARKRALLDSILIRLARNGVYRAMGQWKQFTLLTAQSDFLARVQKAHLSAWRRGSQAEDSTVQSHGEALGSSSQGEAFPRMACYCAGPASAKAPYNSEMSGSDDERPAPRRVGTLDSFRGARSRGRSYRETRTPGVQPEETTCPCHHATVETEDGGAGVSGMGKVCKREEATQADSVGSYSPSDVKSRSLLRISKMDDIRLRE